MRLCNINCNDSIRRFKKDQLKKGGIMEQSRELMSNWPNINSNIHPSMTGHCKTVCWPTHSSSVCWSHRPLPLIAWPAPFPTSPTNEWARRKPCPLTTCRLDQKYRKSYKRLGHATQRETSALLVTVWYSRKGVYIASGNATRTQLTIIDLWKHS